MSCFKNFYLPAQRKRKSPIFLPSGDELQGKGPLFSGPGRQNVILTMGRSGCYWDDGIHQVHFPAAPFGGGGHHRSGGRLCGSPCRHALPENGYGDGDPQRYLAAGFSTAKQGFPIPLSTVPPWNFIWGGSAEKGETSPAHPGQFKKSAHSANQGVRSFIT